MNKAVLNLKQFAEVVGWNKVADDKGFTSYDFRKDLSKREAVTFLLKIFDNLNEKDFYQTLFVIKSVLPKKLRRKVDKITKNVKPENIAGVIEILRFAIEEHKSKTTFFRLKKYGEEVGVDIEKQGFLFEYELTKKQEQEILAAIETKIPMNIAPKIGKIKKIEYKIACFKENKEIEKQESQED